MGNDGRGRQAIYAYLACWQLLCYLSQPGQAQAAARQVQCPRLGGQRESEYCANACVAVAVPGSA